MPRPTCSTSLSVRLSALLSCSREGLTYTSAATFERVAAGAGLGDEYVENLVEAGRYCQDVWAS